MFYDIKSLFTTLNATLNHFVKCSLVNTYSKTLIVCKECNFCNMHVESSHSQVYHLSLTMQVECHWVRCP